MDTKLCKPTLNELGLQEKAAIDQTAKYYVEYHATLFSNQP